MEKVFRLFFYSSGGILLVTATAKVASAFGSAWILESFDPILRVPFRELFWIAAIVEVAVGVVCFCGNRIALQAVLVAWLATNFLVYRLGLIWIGYQKPCPCLGNLTGAIHVSPLIADEVMKLVLTYLLIGSYSTLVWLWWRRGRDSKFHLQ